MQERLSLETEDGIALVELNRPDKHNALDLDMFRAIAGAQKRLARQRDLRAVVLSGAGVDFCSGLDVKALLNDRAGMVRLLWKWLPWQANLAQVVSTGWRDLAVPVIAAIHGRCWGRGLQIALGADLRYSRPDASLAIMEIKWGLIPDMGATKTLLPVVGLDVAKELTFSGRRVKGDEAVRIGLVVDVVHEGRRFVFRP